MDNKYYFYGAFFSLVIVLIILLCYIGHENKNKIHPDIKKIIPKKNNT